MPYRQQSQDAVFDLHTLAGGIHASYLTQTVVDYVGEGGHVVLIIILHTSVLPEARVQKGPPQ